MYTLVCVVFSAKKDVPVISVLLSEHIFTLGVPHVLGIRWAN